MGNDSSDLQTLVDNPVFKHIEVTMPEDNSLRIYFGRIQILSDRNIKQIVVFGVILPILVFAIGVTLAFQGIGWGGLLSLVAMLISCVSLLVIFVVVFYGRLMQLPDVILMDQNQLTWTNPHVHIQIPWADLVSVPAPLPSEKPGKPSHGHNGLRLKTINGTFLALTLRTEKSCDYVSGLIHAYAHGNEIQIGFENDQNFTQTQHFPAPVKERQKLKYVGPLSSVFCACIFGWIAWGEVQNIWRQNNWVLHQARIMNVVVGKEDGKTTKAATYEYTVEQDNYRGRYHWKNIPAYRHTAEPFDDAFVEILMNPNHPKESTIHRSVDWILLAIGLLASSLLTIAAVFLWRHSRMPTTEAEKYSVAQPTPSRTYADGPTKAEG